MEAITPEKLQEIRTELVEPRPLDKEEQEVYDALVAEFGDRTSEDERIRCVRGYAREVPRIPKTIEVVNNLLTYRDKIDANNLLTSEVEKMDVFMDAWPAVIYGEDRYGHVIHAERLADIKTSLIQDMDVDLMLHNRSRCMEVLQHEKEQAWKRRGYRLYQHSYIFDLTGVGSKHASKSVLNVLKPILSLGNDYYPESLYRMYMVNAPFIFRAVWSIIKPWVDPLTQKKIHILGGSSAYLPVMTADGIPIESIPEWAGGQHKGRPVSSDEFSPEAFRAKFEAAAAAEASSSSADAVPVAEAVETAPAAAAATATTTTA